MAIAQQVDAAVKAAGVPIVGISIGIEGDKTTWRVQPPTLQSAAQPTIDAFNPADPALVTAALDAEITRTLDSERLISAVVWTIIDTYSPPATTAKYQNARTKIITAYKGQPWKP